MSSLAGRRQLPLDAISSLLVHGLAKDNAGLPVVIELSREQPREPCTEHLSHLPHPPALPPPLPPTSDPRISLNVELAGELPLEEDDISEEDGVALDDDASCHRLAPGLDDDDPYQRTETRVYSARPLYPEQYPYYIPPFVIKVAAQREGKRIYREACMYKALESVQGLVVPRFYGYFRTTVNQYERTILAWDPQCKFPRDPAKFDIFRPPHPAASLNILLLEEVGDRIPEGTIPRKEVRTELRAMYRELTGLAVDHVDIRYENVLLAPPSPPGLEGKCSPKLGRPYRFRLVDFEHAVRTNRWTLRLDVKEDINDLVKVICG